MKTAVVSARCACMLSALFPLLTPTTATAVDTNVWVGSGAANVATNWSLGIPTAEQHILLNETSMGSLSWNRATMTELPASVAGWTQTAAYTNAVQIDTRRGSSFDMFHITGDAVLNGGSWNHPAGDTVDTIGLRCTIGGNLTTGAAFTFDGLGRGYKQQAGPSGTASITKGVAHGGEGELASSGSGTIYGDCFTPVWRGSSCVFTSGGANGGGGAFYLVIGGTFVHNGRITVTGVSTASYPAHSGGSIFIQAANLTGTGELNAKAAPGAYVNKRVGGGGGRISIHLTGAGVTFDSFTNGFTGPISAAGSVCSKYGATENHYPGACGTVYIETPGDNDKGVMVLDNANIANNVTRDTLGAAVVRSGETWNLSRLMLRNAGRIAIATNATLRLPSPDCIESDGQPMNAIRFDDSGSLAFAEEQSPVLDARAFSILATGNSAYPGPIYVTAPRTLSISGTFTVGGLRINGVPVAPGTYAATELGPLVQGVGTVVVLPSKSVTAIIVR